MSSHVPDAAPRPTPRRQRKTLTVLMTDLCGSSRLGRGMEMELYADVLARVRALWREAAAAHDGLVVREQGDGALLLFGHPRAGEHDVVNAVGAALHIHQGLAGIELDLLPQGPALQARSGIHAGTVLIEDGSPERGLYDLIGDVANIAGTLEKHAAPGEVLVVADALRPHEGLFVVEPRPVPTVQALLSADGMPPARALVARIVGRTGAERRYDATARRGLTPLIGRTELLARLRRFIAAGTVEGRCAVISAPAGLGKTRLLEELSATPEFARWQVLRGGCESYRETEVLQPFMQMLRGLLHGAQAEGREADASRWSAAVASHDVDALRECFGQLAAGCRLLLVVDDWQWADDASRRLLQALLDVPDGPCALLTARPHRDGVDWMPGAVQLRIEPWSEQETAQAVRRWLPADPLLAARIHGYSGGVPLFVEELCHSASAIGLWQQFEGRGTPRDAGLKLLVASRLARLPDDLAQAVRAAAVVGNEVPRWVLDEVCGVPIRDEQVLALADADFLYPDREYRVLRFKHGITRDAVYDDIGFAPRRQMHGRAGQALQRQAADGNAHDLLAALAYHCEGAGEHERAATYAEQAGHAALGAYAMDLARGHYRRAMDALQRAGAPTRERELHACRLVCRYAMACIFDPLALGNDASVFEQAVRRAEALDDPVLQAETRYWLGYMLYGFGRFREAVSHARAALARSREAGRASLATQIEATLGEILVGTCDYDEAVRCIDNAVAAKRQRAGARGGLAVGSAYALACKGSVHADRGDFTQAQACFDEALGLLGPSSHPVGNSVRNWITVAHIWAGDWQRAQQVASESVRISENTGALYLVAVARSTLGFARWCESGDAGGLQMLDDAVSWMAARGGRLFTSLHFGWLAEASAAEGRREQARSLAAHVLQRARQGERLGEAIACRAMALLAVQDGAGAAPERWLLRAERAAAARGSAREQTLNALARGRVAQRLGRPEPPGLDGAREAWRGLGVVLPARSLLRG
jgi:class 3 adenylate cyclase/tetratricopeptide (TPR) repeat protein